MTVKRPDVSVNVPRSGVTSVVPSDGEPEVVATQSSQDPAERQLDMPGFPMEWDENSESLWGQTSGSPTDRGVAVDAIKTGNLSALENVDFGVAGDGAPVIGFMDENGNRQVIRITPGEWLTRLSNRDLARKEMQFQVNAEKKRQSHKAMFHSLVAASGFSEGDRRSLRMAWELDPDNAMKLTETIRNANATKDYERRLMGGVEAMGESWVDVMAELGVDVGSMQLSPKQWRELNTQVTMDELLANRQVDVHGERVPLSQANVWAQHYTQVGERANAAASQLADTFDSGQSVFPTAEGRQMALSQTGRLGTYARGVGYMGLPETATIMQMPAMEADPQSVVGTLVATAIMMGVYTGSLDTAAGGGNDTEATDRELWSLLDAVNHVSTASLGWSPMGRDQLDALRLEVSLAAENWQRVVGGVVRLTPEQVVQQQSDAAQQQALQKSALTAQFKFQAEEQKHRHTLEEAAAEYQRGLGLPGQPDSDGQGGTGSAGAFHSYVNDPGHNAAATQALRNIPSELLQHINPPSPVVSPVLQVIDIVGQLMDQKEFDWEKWQDNPSFVALVEIYNLAPTSQQGSGDSADPYPPYMRERMRTGN